MDKKQASELIKNPKIIKAVGNAAEIQFDLFNTHQTLIFSKVEKNKYYYALTEVTTPAIIGQNKIDDIFIKFIIQQVELTFKYVKPSNYRLGWRRWKEYKLRIWFSVEENKENSEAEIVQYDLIYIFNDGKKVIEKAIDIYY